MVILKTNIKSFQSRVPWLEQQRKSARLKKRRKLAATTIFCVVSILFFCFVIMAQFLRVSIIVEPHRSLLIDP